MASNFLTALAIQFNNDVYANSDGSFGQITGNVPTPGAGGTIDGDYWAVPTDTGAVTGVSYQSTTPGSTDAPDIQAFHVVRITNTNGGDFWYLLGTSTEYIAASQDIECCEVSSPPNVMPTTPPVIAPCQLICPDADGNCIGILALPDPLAEGDGYFPFGTYDGVDLPAADGSGYSSIELLLAFLNTADTGWAAVGTWTESEGTIIVTDADCTENHTLCAAIITV